MKRPVGFRRKLRRLYQAVPDPARSLIERLSDAFSDSTFLRLAMLALAALLTVCRRPRRSLLIVSG
jgi:hypothetical protein